MNVRTKRLARQIREIVSNALLFDASDPRLRFLTITRVEVSADLKSADVYLSVMGSEADKRTCWRALEDSRGFVQTRVAGGLQTRTCPHIRFVADASIEKSLHMAEIFQKIEEERSKRAASSEEPEQS